MKNIFEFPSREHVDQKILEQEAVEWLIKLDGDTPPAAEDLQALKEWMNRSPAHAREIESLSDFWGDLIVLTELNIPLVKQLQGAPLSDRSFFSGRAWALTVSVLGLALLLLQMLLPDWLGEGHYDEKNGYYSSAIGKQTTIRLADGSVVLLNTNSQIHVEYTEHHRNIHLIQGEAHFEVAKNKALPFRVYAGKGRVQAVGTAFTVYLREQDVDVLVTEGKVDLAALSVTPVTASALSDTSSVNAGDNNSPEFYLALPVEQLGRLEAGEGATMLVSQRSESGSKQRDLKVKPMDAGKRARRDTWRKGLVLFTGDSLEDVIAEVGRYSPVVIEILDPELKKIRVGGQFRVGDIDSMFDVLESNFGLHIKPLGNNQVRILAAEGPKK